jgi:GWxTD domain-containing protein
VSPPIFYVDTTSLLGDPSTTGVRVTVSVPYNQLHFAKADGGGYEADFDVVAIFYGEKDRQVEGDVWRHKVRVSRYKDTRSRQQTFVSSADFALPPGDYTLEVRVGSVGLESSSAASRPVHVEPPPTQGILLSAIEIGTCADSLSGIADSASAGFVASTTRRFGDPLPQVCARASVFARGVVREEVIDVVLRILGEDDRVEVEETVPLRIVAARTGFVIGVPVEPLAPGTYALVLAIERGGETAAARRNLEIDASRIDLRRNYEDFVELARLYVGSEADALRGVPEEERRERWDAFWKAQDANPSTPENEALEEFLERVRVAANRFAQRGEAGWRTDRGRVFIRYGEPEDIEQVPRGFNSPAYEIWRYLKRNLTFVFADHTGFGDYILVQPSGQL